MYLAANWAQVALVLGWTRVPSYIVIQIWIIIYKLQQKRKKKKIASYFCTSSMQQVLGGVQRDPLHAGQPP